MNSNDARSLPLIDLGKGQPDLGLLPVQLLQAAARARFATDDPVPLQYGPTVGSSAFRALTARFWGKGDGRTIDPDRLFITAGASHALDLICGRFTNPGDVVFVESPTYFYALEILAARGLVIQSVPVDENGLDVTALEAAIAATKPKLVYTIPIHQNPTGVTLSPARRARLLELAAAHDFLVVADEVYQLLTYEGDAPQSLANSRSEHVCSLGSFSKVLSPGLRLGFVETTPARVATLAECGVLRSGGGVSPFAGAVVEEVMKSDEFVPYLEGIRSEYRKRRDVLAEALQRLVPSAQFTVSPGGFFVWVSLPGRDVGRLATRASGQGLAFRDGTLFSQDDAHRSCLRLSFTYYPCAVLEEGVRRLRRLLDNDAQG